MATIKSKKNDNVFGSSTKIRTAGNYNVRLIIISFIIIIVLVNIFVPKKSPYEKFDIPKEGEITKKAIVAPFTFDILKTNEEYNKERSEAMQNVLHIMEYDYDVTEKMFKKFNSFFKNINQLKKRSLPDSTKKNIWTKLKKDVSVSTIRTLINSKINFENMLYIIDEILDKGISSILFVKDVKERDEYKKKYNLDFVNYIIYDKDFVTLLRDGEEKTVQINTLLKKEQILEREKQRFRKNFPKRIFNSVYELIYAYLAPNIFYNEEETQKRKIEAANSVLKTSGKVVKDLEIVGKNKLVTPEIHRRLYSLSVAQKRLNKSNTFNKLFPVVGKFLINLIIILLLFIYIFKLKKKYFKSSSDILSITLIIALQFVLNVSTSKFASIITETLNWSANIVPEYFLPVIIGPMLVTILYDLEIGISFSVIMAILSGVMFDFEYKTMLVHIFVSITACVGIKNIRYRTHFFVTFFFYTLAYLVSISTMELLKYESHNIISSMKNFGLASISGLISLMITIILVWVFEKLFGYTTNLTLIEIADMNSPVLKRLSIDAPGTYHHSVLIGNLAESAAETIGANPLKTRVLAYYHDIGKLNKPEYFIENQVSVNDNLHAKISPKMSALIISSHVKQGIEIAKQYKLPKLIIDVIKEHHGTTLISFFYEKTKQDNPDKPILREDFCYPGPKPSSKESALIMLADSVEAASRSLKEPTTSRLRGLVNSIFDDKIADGQLDNCDLTLKDLAKIKDSFMPILTGMFHTRIEYPDKESTKEKSATKK